MENRELVERLAELQMLCKRYVERNTNYTCKTIMELNRLIMGNKLTCTYEFASKTLLKNINEWCKNSEYLNKEANTLYENIKKSTIADLRFGYEPQKRFNDDEKNLDRIFLVKQLQMQSGLYSIKEVSELISVTESAIKQACQQERLMNTRKVSKTWLVDIKECKKYWDK